jgi:predicted HTH domain antitoxin
MESVNVRLPSELLRAANLEERNLSQGAARLLALEPYREDKVSLGRAAELMPDSVGGFHGFRGEARCPPSTLQL